MKLKDILIPENIQPEIKADTRDGTIEELVELVADQVPVSRDEIVRILEEREDQSPTAMSGGVAVPHGRIPELGKFILAVGRKKKGLPFGGEDGNTSLFFLLIAPTDDTVTHLKILARIARICRNAKLKQEIMEAGKADEIYQALMKEDSSV